MKKTVIITLLVCLSSVAVADIQAPPGARQEPLRKLSRALSNIIFGVTEITNTWTRQMEYDSTQAFSEAAIRGTGRTVSRIGFGIYEVITFPFPTTKGSYRPPYQLLNYDPNHGFAEYPPEVGFKSASKYARCTPY